MTPGQAECATIIRSMLDPDIEIEPDPMHFTDERIWTVSQITSRVKNLIEGDPSFSRISVRGEVTNLSTSKAGHIYFGLKDAKCYLKCVAFRSAAEKLTTKPVDGREVLATGRLNVWETGGSYQLIVDQINDIGLGALWLEFEKTRKKLTEEGLFDEENKRPLPQLPRLIGLVTSQTGAALRDIIRIFRDRAPYVSLVLSPSLVQGENAPESLIAALNLLEMWDDVERQNGKAGLDMIIIGRGGGSFEDLACFNDEALIRRVRETRVPVISAVGHEVDFTIIDFASDLRAATPTQAAQLATPSAGELLDDISAFLGEYRRISEIKLQTYRTRFSNITSRPIYRRPLGRIDNFRQNLDAISGRTIRAVLARLKDLRHQLQSVVNRLESLDPTAILMRGYSLAFNRSTGRLITTTDQTKAGMPIDLRVSDGYIKLIVEEENKVK